MNVFQENSLKIVPLRRKCVTMFRTLLARLQSAFRCQRVSCICIYILFRMTLCHHGICYHRVSVRSSIRLYAHWSLKQCHMITQKFCMLTDIEEYYCMHNRLPLKGICPVSCDLFKFSEISVTILVMVQDRDIIAVED